MTERVASILDCIREEHFKCLSIFRKLRKAIHFLNIVEKIQKRNKFKNKSKRNKK